MKKLAIVAVLALAACDEGRTGKINSIIPNLTLASEQGAGFSPYYRAEYDARLELGQPGLVPYQEPVRRGTTYGDFQRQQQAERGVVTVQDGIVTKEEAIARATETPTTYRLSATEVVTVVRTPEGGVKATYAYVSG